MNLTPLAPVNSSLRILALDLTVSLAVLGKSMILLKSKYEGNDGNMVVFIFKLNKSTFDRVEVTSSSYSETINKPAVT